MNEPIKVLIIEDDQTLLGAIVFYAEHGGTHDIEVVGTAGTEKEALHLLEICSCDVVLCDMRLPPAPGEPKTTDAGLRIIETVERMPDGPSVLAISEPAESPEFVMRAASAGAQGYILKTRAKPDDVFQAIRDVYRGIPVFPPDVVTLVRRRQFMWPNLSDDEQTVWRLIAEGFANREIGDRLGKSEDAVRNLVRGLYAELGARNRAQAARLFAEWQHGTIEVSDE